MLSHRYGCAIRIKFLLNMTSKYQDLKTEIDKIWRLKTTVITSRYDKKVQIER